MNTYTLIDDLAKVPDHFSASILLRHSDRFPILDPKEVFQVGLTPLGIHKAEEFGKLLAHQSRKVGRLLSTPVGRCVDTANGIARGAGLDISVSMNQTISYPVIEPAWLWLLDNFPNRNGLPKEIQAAKDLLLNQSNRNPSLDIFITHDSVIACMIGYLVGEMIEYEYWVDFLEGFIVWKENSRIYLRWRNQQYDITDGR